MTQLGIVLDYGIRKAVHLFSVDKEYGKDELRTKLIQVAEDYTKTDAGESYIKNNKGVLTLHDLMEIKDDIPNDIYKKYGILPDFNVSGYVIEMNAFERLIEQTPVKAVFGVYDQDYEIHKGEMKHLLDSVDWMNQDYVFRPLMLDNRCVGFGFLSIEMTDDESFQLNEFMNYVANIAYSEAIIDNKIYEYEGIGIKMLRLDIFGYNID